MADVEVKAKLSVDTGDSAQKIDVVKKGLQSTGAETGKTTGTFSKLKAELGGIQGPAGQATQSLGLVTQALNVLKAHPIIGIFILIAGLVYALFQRFKQMEGVSDSLGKAWASLSGIFDTFMNYVLTPLIEGFTTLIGWITEAAEWLVGQFSPALAEAGKRSGQLAEALDELEDAERNAAIARAESNRKLQEARELAADANVPIKQRIAALKEAGRIEKQELENSIRIATERARIMTEQIAIELGARADLIKAIRTGNIEALKAARNELMAMKNVNMDKVKEIDALLIKAEDEGAALAKISKKTQSQITSIEREEQSKRDAAAKEAKAKRDQRIKEEQEQRKKEAEEKRKLFDAEIAELKRKNEIEIAYLREQSALRDLEEVKKQQRLDADIARQNRGLANQVAAIEAKKAADAQALALEEAQTQIRLTFSDRVSGALGALADTVGRQTAIGKGLALAEIAIGTAVGFVNGLRIAQQSAAGTGPGAAFAFPIFYATQIGAVLSAVNKARGILSTVKGPGSGGGGAATAPAASAVNAPITPQQASTQLNSSTIQAIGSAAAGGVNRAYVLDSDITNTNERNTRLQRAATLG